MPAAIMEHIEDPRKKILDEIGDITDFELFHNQVLVAVYLRPEKTKGGIFVPDQNRDEDRYQGKVGLIVKAGPDAFNDPGGKWFQGVELKLHDWIVFKPSDGWGIEVNKRLCRMLDDTNIRARIQHPDMAW